MSNTIFVPDNDSLCMQSGLRTGGICYKFNDSPYQTIFRTPKQRLFYKICLLSPNECLDNFNVKALPVDEKTEYKKLFDNIYKVPKEDAIKKCLIVIAWRDSLAIGLESVNGNNVTVFKSTHINEIEKTCEKHRITIKYDKYFTSYLLLNAYLHEILPEEIWEHTARKFVKIMRKDKAFREKLKLFYDFD
jgi:hypothetical protein